VIFHQVVHPVLAGKAGVATLQSSTENRMNIHKNARLTPHGRELIVRQIESGQTPEAAARAAGVCPRTARKWVARFKAEGVEGLKDRSSRPHRLRQPTPAVIIETVEALRRRRFTGKQISAALGISPATVSRILRRLGLNRIQALEPAEPVRRYERQHPGELIHIDIKKLGRFDQVGHRITGDRSRQSNRRGHRDGARWGAGWEYVHVCVDDASRIAFSQILPDEKKQSAVAFLKAAVAYYASLGVTVSRVMTDNGACYKAFDFRNACRDLGLKHIRTKPYTPKTNGKAERFIQTALREWAYAKAYPTSQHRAHELPCWLHRYNWHRPHGGLNSRTPISRLALDRNNLLRLHI
jgi:transposase InsO family protein